mmetsp:Transcript_2154/g.6563  ORF Transcript_2154/g.6563 Transcript_2154/m.6563 type:complete len:219 (+) Transcript_2154:1881-2537(+)
MHVDGPEAALLHALEQALQIAVVPPGLLLHHRISRDLLVHDVRPLLAHPLVAPDAALADLHETAPLPQEPQRPRDVVVVAQAVEYHVDALGARLAQEALHVFFKLCTVPAARDVFHTEPAQEVMLFLSAGGCKNLSPNVLGILNGDQANASSRCMDEHTLALPQPGQVSQRLFDSDEDDWHRAGLFEGPSRGLCREESSWACVVRAQASRRLAKHILC